MTAAATRLGELDRDLARAAAARDGRAVAAGWRAVLDYFFEVRDARADPEPGPGDTAYRQLWDRAKQALANLGGQAEPPAQTLADYDAGRYGPMLGVSDEGSATAAIRHGALASPKCAALSDRTPLTVGVAHDGERLGAVGEVVVGPDEYAAIRLACRGRLLTTTNVGAEVHLRHFLDPPEVRIGPGKAEPITAAAIEKLKAFFAPFTRTPSGRDRGRTVLVRFDPRVPTRQQGDILKCLQAAAAGGEFGSPRWHHIGLVADPGGDRATRARAAIDLAARAGVGLVALSGPLARFDPDELAGVLRYATEHKVRVGPKSRVDPQTTARHLWTGLSAARNMGLDLGKYGLVPLAFEDQKEVIARIQYWFPHWAAAPVCYVDHPLVTATDVFHGPRLAAGVRRWLDMVAKHQVRVVLIDTVKKSEGRRLLKDGPADTRGFLTADEVSALTAFATARGISVLWAGGITLPQAYEFGRLGVFGVYVTSAAAALRPVGRKYRKDPALAASREPQPEAVARVKLVLEAGFLAGRSLIPAGAADALLAAVAAGDETATARREAELHPLAVAAWRAYWASPENR